MDGRGRHTIFKFRLPKLRSFALLAFWFISLLFDFEWFFEFYGFKKKEDKNIKIRINEKSHASKVELKCRFKKDVP